MRALARLMLLALLPHLTSCFVEDYCVYNTTAKPTPGIVNFYDAAEQDKCAYGSYLPKCIKDVVKVSANTFGDTSVCRGTVHFDSVYIMASAVGILPEYAYFLAAFSQAIDFVQYAAIDSCG